jgi:CTP synthase
MQMAVIEAARDLIGLENAGSEEFDHEAGVRRFEPVVYHLKEWVEGNRTVQRAVGDDKGGTMRLGAYDAHLKPGSLVAGIYGSVSISERHRHRYEVNNEYLDRLLEAGAVAAGINEKLNLVEILEIKDHPWFVAVQFHPEFKSKPTKAHPLFENFIRAAVEEKKGGKKGTDN